jgi:hypothetical protein
MRSLVARFTLAATAMLSIAGQATAASAPKDAAIEMAPLKVSESFGAFELDVRLDPHTKRVSEIEVTWVSLNTEQNGLRAGFVLMSIDDKPVVGLQLDDVLGVKKRAMAPRDTQKLVFRGRGLRGEVRQITWTSRGLRPLAVVKVDQ